MTATRRFSRTPRPLNVGVVGLGYWGPNIARAWASLEDARLRWICDLDAVHLERIGRLYPDATPTRELDELLGDPAVDLVSIATSVPTHAALAARAIEAGKHVLVEKPLATSVEDARYLQALAADRGVQLHVGHLLVHHPGVRKLRELVDTGVLGRTRYIYSNRVNLGQVRSDENALWSLGAHDVSVLLHLLGEPVAVSAQGECFIRPDVEDVVFALLRFPGGVMAHMQLSWLDPHKMRRFTVVGSDKMAVFDDMRSEQKVTVYDKGVTMETGQPTAPSYGEYVLLRSGDTFSPRISSEEPLRLECRHVVDCIRGEETPRAAGAEGVAVVEVLEAMQRSLKLGGEMVRLVDEPAVPAALAVA